MTESDEELIVAYLHGTEEALASLVARHLPAVYSFALRFVGDQSDAEDIAQETFYKGWKNLHRYHQESSSFKTWLMHIARNTAIDHLRKRKQIPFSDFENDEGETPFANLADDAPLPEELARGKDDVREIEKALQTLSSQYREILLLYAGNTFTFQEIGVLIGASTNTVKSRYRRALALLRKALTHQR